MNLITILWSMSASACLTLAAINFLVWSRNRKAWANLFFSLVATGTAGWAFSELRMMLAGTPAEFATVLKWGQVAVWLLVLSLVGFVRVYLQAGRLWLVWTVCGMRTLALVLNFLVGRTSTTSRSLVSGRSPFSVNPSRLPRVCPTPVC